MLPGIDDGPPDLHEAVAMARAAVGAGIATIAATPHLHPDFPGVHLDELATRCRDLREAFDREQIPLELVSGAEVSLTWAIDASDQQLSLASYGQRGTDLLIETPFVPVVGLDRFLYQLQAKGYRVTLGHPERSSHFQGDEGVLRALVEQGALLQLNADSLLGAGGGRGRKRLAQSLLRDGLTHVIASDGHRASSWRPVTRLDEAVKAAAELVGPERARWMAQAAPAAILAGEALPSIPPISKPRSRRRFFGLS
jgi:protein-tyrosine phosphatase